MNESKMLVTWNGKSTFSYVGSVKEGTIIFTGNNSCPHTVSPMQYQELINHFKGKVVDLGTVGDLKKRPSGSLGKWIGEKVCRTRIVSYYM